MKLNKQLSNIQDSLKDIAKQECIDASCNIYISNVAEYVGNIAIEVEELENMLDKLKRCDSCSHFYHDGVFYYDNFCKIGDGYCFENGYVNWELKEDNK